MVKDAQYHNSGMLELKKCHKRHFVVATDGLRQEFKSVQLPYMVYITTTISMGGEVP